MEDLQKASKLLVKALQIREFYMSRSQQAFPNVCRKFLRKRLSSVSSDTRVHKNKATLEGEGSSYGGFH